MTRRPAALAGWLPLAVGCAAPDPTASDTATGTATASLISRAAQRGVTGARLPELAPVAVCARSLIGWDMLRAISIVVLGCACGDVVNKTVDGPPNGGDEATLMVSRTGTGTGTVASRGGEIQCGGTCEATVAVGTSIMLTATQDATATFVGWSGACSGTGDCTVSVDAHVTVTAEFTLNGLTVVPAGTGRGVVTSTPDGITCGMDCNEVYPNGTMVTLDARPSGGSTFDGWEGPCTGTGDCIVTTLAAQTVTARFTCGGSTTFTFTGSAQSFVPPPCATTLVIDASGAQGGNGGGLGAHAVGTFAADGAVGILVGGQGGQGVPGSPNTNGGGGGGSFVFKSATDANPLLAAGGGGGKSQIAGVQDGGPGAALPTNSTGGAGNAAGGAATIGGAGGTQTGAPGSPGTGGGGSGWIGNGVAGTVAAQGGGGRSPRNGGSGGVAGTGGAAGGFGGGGGSAGSVGASGGGGGFAGGGGGNGFNNSAWGSGGGGGSFNGGANQTNAAAARVGNGIVIVTWQ